MKTAIAIPARLNSTRFPKKILADLCGKPVIQRVYELACFSGTAEEVFILVDSDEVAAIVKNFCDNILMTSPQCSCGTDRIVSILDKISADFIINIQGDEPLLDVKILKDLKNKAAESAADIITPVFQITSLEDVMDPSRVKAAVAHDGRALYFSRSPIPFVRGIEPSQWLQHSSFFGHIGVYGYQRGVLENYKNLHESSLEAAELLEQLKFLDNGYTIDTVLASHPTVGIDTPQDLEKARNFLNKNHIFS